MKAERDAPGQWPGVLIVFEGIDGAGKTTQAQRLCLYLRKRDYPAITLEEPTLGRWGREIQRIAKQSPIELTPEQELELFTRDREEDVRRHILPALRDGKVVIMDRYYFSSMAYQGARGLDPQAIRRRNEEFAPRPDLVILLDIPVDLALERIRVNGRKRSSFEKKELLERVHKIFSELTDPSIRRMDATRPPDEVQHEVCGLVDELLRSRS